MDETPKFKNSNELFEHFVDQAIENSYMGRGIHNTAGFIAKFSGAAIGAVYLSGKNHDIINQVVHSGSISNSANVIIDTIKQAGELIAQHPGVGILAAAGYMVADQGVALGWNLIGKAVRYPLQFAKAIAQIIENSSSLQPQEKAAVEGKANIVR